MTDAPQRCLTDRRRDLSKLLLGLLLFLVLTGCSTIRQEPPPVPQVQIESLKGFPKGEQGYDLGVSACYAGVVGNRLIVAGGCNFPEKGKKRYYSGIYAAPLDEDSLRWKLVGRLPHAAAYGASVVSGDSLILIGGCNNDARFSDVISLKFTPDSTEVVVSSMIALPVSIDNGTATVGDETVYVAGGNQNGTPSQGVWSLDLHAGGVWKSHAPLPAHPRVQPVSAWSGSRLFVWGGYSPSTTEPIVAVTGLAYVPERNNFSPLSAPFDLSGEALTLSGGCAVALTTDRHRPYIFAMGGVNKDIFLDAISNRYQLIAQKDYLDQDPSWYRFNKLLLCYDVDRQAWLSPLIEDERLARAGATAVVKGNKIYFIGGELKPGVRVAAVVRLSVDF